MSVDAQVIRITNSVKQKDPSLFAQRDSKGVVHIYRNKEFNQGISHIISLTDNWSVSGKPIDRGVVQVIDRLSMIDSWNDEFIRRMDKENQEAEAEKKRDFSNKVESFCRYELRDSIKKTFNDVNTSCLDRKKGRFHDGNRK